MEKHSFWNGKEKGLERFSGLMLSMADQKNCINDDQQASVLHRFSVAWSLPS